VIPHFYYSSEILNYNFGPQHPLKPERLRRTIELLERYGLKWIDSGPGSPADPLRVHSEDYVEAVRVISESENDELRAQYGFWRGDNPSFPGMWPASLAYTSASARAAEAVRDGASLAFGIGGGLHHALRERAAGFCVFNDCAVACNILLERFEQIAYVDIDVHHGDGVQWLFYDDPRVLTCSIHEDPRTLFPGTGAVTEMGVEGTSFNVPVQAKTTGDIWLALFEHTIPRALDRFQPEAIVLQLGTDTHYLDPLGHLQCTQQDWLAAAKLVQQMGVPVVALGGGGYNLRTVPRMWASAVLELAEVEYDDKIPEDLAERWDMPLFSDPTAPGPSGTGAAYADEVVEWLQRNHPMLS
jgi:acetoin utilization protein AcuC